ncbi:uncharacterized protein N0V89_004768 [Didymosphaeria variabile]|uniref:Heterokaryon incompatibility domain-containing protein n=1 Tax=Didymosphaeria variabile TaxID=1932322 RepID=A0A9W8XR61_9PLEO|nr:uncharacterized protein N0V89_004768 [Didymosphaeria variabile]KAJ4356732.1 hypothetical protein N0V89_004768 [Didymosphaeria variabile]
MTIWLGPVYSGSASALDFIREVDNTCNDAVGAYDWVAGVQFSADAGAWTGYFSQPKEEIQFETLMALRELFRRRYWSRLWIIQEILFARLIVVRCGDRLVEWEKLLDFQVWTRSQRYLVVKHFQQVSDILHVPSNVRKILDTKRAWGLGDAWKQPTQSLRRVLSDYRMFECVNEFDKVYGLLGLVTKGTTVPVDYAKETTEVFKDVIKAVLTDDSITMTGFLGFSFTLWGTICAVYPLNAKLFSDTMVTAAEEAENDTFDTRKKFIIYEHEEAEVEAASNQVRFSLSDIVLAMDSHGVDRWTDPYNNVPQ